MREDEMEMIRERSRDRQYAESWKTEVKALREKKKFGYHGHIEPSVKTAFKRFIK